MTLSMAMFVEVASYFSWIATAFAIITNSVLFYLFSKATTPSFGNYTTLLTANSINLIVFSFLHSFVQPIISIEQKVVYVFAAKNYLQLPVMAMRLLLSAYGVTYCMSLVLCSLTFVFRFNKVCNQERKLFDTRSQMCLWFSLVALIGLFWGFCIFYLAVATPYVDAIIEKPLRDFYDVNLEEVTYVAAVYTIMDPTTGSPSVNWQLVAMSGSFLLIIGGTMVTTGYCVYQIARKTDEFKETTIYDPIQKQLFYAQLVQMAIPFAFVFIPIAIVLICPIFEFNGNVAFSLSSIFVSIFPIVDPIAMMLLISSYRQELFSCCCNHKY
uniref:Seven TM Receptor n=2 Tax=Caenorhabditis japonica TaxID=281687 RepID=A0A8R1HX64_CAEJA